MNILDAIFYIALGGLVGILYFLYKNRFKILFEHYLGLDHKKAHQQLVTELLMSMEINNDPNFSKAVDAARKCGFKFAS